MHHYNLTGYIVNKVNELPDEPEEQVEGLNVINRVGIPRSQGMDNMAIVLANIEAVVRERVMRDIIRRQEELLAMDELNEEEEQEQEDIANLAQTQTGWPVFEIDDNEGIFG
jgi:hypothetical protein